MGRLVAELESLLQQLVSPDEEWRRRSLGHWGALEEVFAVALDRSSEHLDAESRSIVETAISELRALAGELLTAHSASSSP